MFELENALLKYFAVVPIRSFQGPIKFQMQCHNCKKGILQYPLQRDLFCEYAGCAIEKHMFGSSWKNELSFATKETTEKFHTEDINIHQCTNCFIPTRVRGHLKLLMNDLRIKKHEVPHICRVTYASFHALPEIMTDGKGIYRN